jgi:predicted transcriptional regulator
MAVVNQIDKKVRMNKLAIVKYQLVTHCFLFYIQLSDAELNCLAYLVINGEQELTSLCNLISDQKIFLSAQSARNCLTKLEKKGLIVKEGKNKKKIAINPKLNIQSEGNILLNFKFLSVES